MIAAIQNELVFMTEVVQYDMYTEEGGTPASVICPMDDPTSDICKTDSQGAQASRHISGNCALRWNGFVSTMDAVTDWGKECEFYIKVNADVEGPVYMYYQIDHVFQNHREYVKSRSFKMEHGDITTAQAEDCSPMRYTTGQNVCNAILQNNKAHCEQLGATDCSNDDLCITGKTMVPCGNAAYSTFNDRFQATLLRQEEGEPELRGSESTPALTPINFPEIYNAASGAVQGNYDKMLEEISAEKQDLRAYKLCCDDERIRSFPFALTGPGSWLPQDGVVSTSANPPTKELLAGSLDTPKTIFASPWWSKNNIAWPTDVESKYKYASWDAASYTDQGPLQAAQSTHTVERCKARCAPDAAPPAPGSPWPGCPFSTTDNYQERCEQLTMTLPRMDDEDFIVWMRYATTQDFSKLHRVLDFNLKAGDVLLIKAFNYFQLPMHGRKKLFLSTAASVGGKGFALAALWIFDAGVCALIAAVFCVWHRKKSQTIEKEIDTILFRAQKKSR